MSSRLSAKARIFIFPLILVFIFVVTKSIDLEQDLGRHLMLGKIIFETKNVPHINMFSFTYPQFPFINHHWFSEVILYLFVSWFGLHSLFILRAILVLSAVWITLYTAFKNSSDKVAAFISLLFLPLLVERLYIRPELFGFLLFSILYSLLFFSGKNRFFYFIPFIMFAWVNLHISFVFGLCFILLYAIGNIKHYPKKTLLLLLFTSIALLCNPNGLNGVLYPFTIFGNYGYSIVENQNIFFLNSVMLNPTIRYFFFLTPLVLGSIVTLFFVKKYKIAFLLGVFFIAAIWQIRHIPFFVFFAIPAVSMAIQSIINYIFSFHFPFGRMYRYFFAVIYFGLATVCIIFFITGTYNNVFDVKNYPGVGFWEEEKEATDFIKNHTLPKHIFNNFDVGGYLIYKLYPQYKVFVDNRPEAYPADFFKNIYIPLQEHKETRRTVFKTYRIHTVVFSHQDGTPWGDIFIRDIANDSDWHIVFLNSKMIILTDDRSFKDIRTTPLITQLVDKENSYLSLLYLSAILEKINLSDISRKAFEKAYKMNPLSCHIKKIVYQIEKNTPDFFVNQDIKRIPWWCL